MLGLEGVRGVRLRGCYNDGSILEEGNLGGEQLLDERGLKMEDISSDKRQMLEAEEMRWRCSRHEDALPSMCCE